MDNIQIYDNGGRTYDRYTVIYMNEPERAPNTFAARGMSEHPFHPLGFGQCCSAMPGRHLGLPHPVRSAPERLPAPGPSGPEPRLIAIAFILPAQAGAPLFAIPAVVMRFSSSAVAGWVTAVIWLGLALLGGVTQGP